MTDNRDWLLVADVAKRYNVSKSNVLARWNAGKIAGELVEASADNPMPYVRIDAESARAWFEGRPRQGVGAALDRLQARIAELEDALTAVLDPRAGVEERERAADVLARGQEG